MVFGVNVCICVDSYIDLETTEAASLCLLLLPPAPPLNRNHISGNGQEVQ